jgi:hypothetical protein
VADVRVREQHTRQTPRAIAVRVEEIKLPWEFRRTIDDKTLLRERVNKRQ